MGGYRSWRGPVSGMTLWHVEAEPGDQRILPDGVMDLMWFREARRLAGTTPAALVP
jgi:hypothetical protein